MITSSRTDKTTNQVIYLTEVAETLREDALTKASMKFTPHERNRPLAELLKRNDFCDYFKYELTVGVALVMAAHDRRIQAAYVYNPSDNPDGAEGIDVQQDVTLHLLVRVEALSAALEAFVFSLDRALTVSLRELPSPLFAQRRSVLMVDLISEEDVVLRQGSAALLSSVFAPPLKVWEREV
jgi:hypothetical protein